MRSLSMSGAQRTNSLRRMPVEYNFMGAARLQIAGRLDQASDFIWAQYVWRSVMSVFGVGNGVGWKPALQRTHEEETQASGLRHDRSHRQLALM